MKVLILSMVLVFLPVIAGGAQPALPLAEALPADALVYIGWAGRSLTFDGSHLGQALQGPAMHAAAASLKSTLLSAAGQYGAEHSAAHAWALADVLWRHPLALAVYPPTSEQGAMHFLAVADAKQDRDSVARLLEAFQESLEVEVETTDIGGAAFHKVTHDNTTVYWALVGSRLIVTSDPSVGAKMLATKPATSLASDEQFNQRLKEVVSTNLQLALYVDTGSKLFPDRSAPAGPTSTEFHRFLQALHRGYVAHATCIENRGIRSRTRLALPGLDKGLIAALRGGDLKMEDLDWVPRDAVLVWAARVDASKLVEYLTESREGFPAAGPLRRLATLIGDRWVLASAPSLGGMFTGTVLSVTVGNREGLEQDLERYLALIGGGPQSLRMIRVGQRTIRYAVAPGANGAVSPAYTIGPKRLYIAAWPQVLQSLLALDSEERLVVAPHFRDLHQTLGSPGQFVEYVNPQRLVDTLYGALMVGASLLSNEAAQQGGRMSPELLPSIRHVSRLLSPRMVSMRFDEKGSWSDSYGPTGGLGNVLAIPSLSAAVSVLLPSIAKARQIAKFVVSSTRIKSIHAGIVQYEADHGQGPETLADLVRGGYVRAEALHSPLDDDPETQFVQGRVLGHVSYVYRLPGRALADLPAGRVVLHTRMDLACDGRVHVVFVDGRVEEVEVPRLRKLIAGDDDPS